MFIKRYINNNNGAALFTVIMIFVVIMIISASVLIISDNNLKQIIFQESNMKAHYLARSGIELGYSALMINNPSILLDTFKSGGPNRNSTLNLSDASLLPVSLPLGEGAVDIQIVRIPSPTVAAGDTSEWIQIISTGTYKTITSRVRLRFRMDNSVQRIIDTP